MKFNCMQALKLKQKQKVNIALEPGGVAHSCNIRDHFNLLFLSGIAHTCTMHYYLLPYISPLLQISVQSSLTVHLVCFKKKNACACDGYVIGNVC